MFISLFVFFEDPFWVGLFTKVDDGTTSHCRVVFGQEPTDAELYQFIQDRFTSLVFHESTADTAPVQKPPAANPKRRQKQAARELKNRSSVTRAMDDLRRNLAAAGKAAKKAEQKRRAEDARQKALQQTKRKKTARHRGH